MSILGSLTRILDFEDRIGLYIAACGSIGAGVALLCLYGLSEGSTSAALMIDGAVMALVARYALRRRSVSEEPNHRRRREE